MKPTRTKQQRERDKQLITELYVQGVPQMEIAKRLGISQGQVSNDWKKIVAEWQESRFEELDRYKHEQLKRIDLIERELWEAWNSSKVLKKVSSVKSKSGRFKDAMTGMPSAAVSGAGAKVADEEFWRASVSEEDPRGGDMQFMNGIMWCISERTKLLGLYAPKKIAQTNPEGDQEAGAGARDELMGLLAAVIKRNDTEAKALEEAVDAEIVSDDLVIAKQLRERRSLPAGSPAAADETFGLPDETPADELSNERRLDDVEKLVGNG